MDSMMLSRLNDCAKSTRLGVVDQGFPETMRKLAVMGFVKPVGSGYQVTDQGFAYLDTPAVKQQIAKL